MRKFRVAEIKPLIKVLTASESQTLEPTLVNKLPTF